MAGLSDRLHAFGFLRAPRLLRVAIAIALLEVLGLLAVWPLGVSTTN